MTKLPLILSFIIFITTESAHALQCYVTDMDALRHLNIDAEPIRKDCKQYFADFGYSGDVVGNEFRCSTVTALLSEGRMSIQGCLTAADTCDQIKDGIRSIVSASALHVNSVTCDVCQSDNCNGGVSRTVVINRGGTSTTTVYMIAFLVIVGTMVVVVGVTLFIRKKKTTPGYVHKV